MYGKSVFLGIFSALVLSWSAPAQTLAPAPPTVPPAAVCAAGAENYGAISSYLNNGNVYKSTILAPAISASTTYPSFEYNLAQALAVDQQQIAFLASCNFNVAPSCQPGTEVLATTTPAEVASLLQAFDADEGLVAIQGFFSIPAPSTNFNPREALNNFFTITEGAYCLFHPYLVHPVVVKGLKAPKF